MMEQPKFILDATASFRCIWENKHHPTGEESNHVIWKHYSELERKYLQLLGVLDKHVDSNGKSDPVINALYKQIAKDKQTVFAPVNKSGELLLLLEASQLKNKESK